jgi:ribosome-associated protein
VAVAELSDARLAAIEMPDALREAIEMFRRTRSHEGRRRQMQYVGKLMRSADEAALREAVAAATLGSARETLALHEAERWRAELVADDGALDRWLQAHPDTETQQLRSLVRAARRDANGLAPEARQPKSWRELFQFIKPMLGR